MSRSAAVVVLASLLLGLPLASRAEPYLAVQTGLKCVACHVNPTGGGLRNAAGVSYAQRVLPANQLPESLSGWTGGLGEYLRVGGDYRASSSQTELPGQPSQRVSGVDQFRLYGDVQILPERIGVYLDETLAPGKAQRQEAYLRLSTPGMAWYAKAGQFYLPFGWRLQDNASFVRSVSGINMTAPDKGVEFGMEADELSAQLAYSRGPGNAGTGSGHQLTGQIVWLQPWGRVGAALASTRAQAGDRQVVGLFGGTRTGALAWLAEIDLVRDDGYPEGRRSLLAALAEVNWQVAQGHNLKLTGEYFDPDRRVANDHRLRQSLVYEVAPLPFVQLRAGYRRYLGIPQIPIDNRRQSFIELHGLF